MKIIQLNRKSPEFDVYVGSCGDICIRQVNREGGEEAVLVPRDDVPKLAELLIGAYEDALQFNDETAPAPSDLPPSSGNILPGR